MTRLILSRIGLGLLTLLAVSVVIFVLTQILPGDVASAVLGQAATPETLANYRHELGLDRPAVLRYFIWLGGVLHGDFGASLTNKQNIVRGARAALQEHAVPRRLRGAPRAAAGQSASASCRPSGRAADDRLANIVALLAISMPEFFVGYLLILNLAVNHEWFPSLATVSDDMSFAERVWTVTLPAVTLTVLVTAHMLRMTRNSVLSTMSTAYVEMAFLKGLSRARVVTRHALPNAASPVISVIALTSPTSWSASWWSRTSSPIGRRPIHDRRRHQARRAGDRGLRHPLRRRVHHAEHRRRRLRHHAQPALRHPR